MSAWTVGQLLDAVQGQLIAGDQAVAVQGVSIDSRRLAPGQAFLAIEGPRFNGHAFLAEVVDRGASCLIVSQRPSPLPSIPVIVVPDTTRALGRLAAYHRRRFAVPVIAVTGSCGKTTTKELIAHLLGASAGVLKTRGTENNHIGLPLTLLQLSDAHACAVVELGSNHPGEIAYLAAIAHPTVAVITNIGPAHLEFFGSLEAVRREKLSLLAVLAPGGTAIVPGDQLEVVLEAKSRLEPGTTLLTFGTSSQCGVQLIETRRHAQGLALRLRDMVGEFAIPLPGFHNVENALAALTCVHALGVPLEAARQRLQHIAPVAMRSEVVRCNGFTLVNDCYNANPLSFARALEVLKDLPVLRRVVIAGDMLELGAFAPTAHQAIGRLAAQLGIDVIMAVGSFASEIAHGASESAHPQTTTYRSVEELLQQLPSVIRTGDGILIKGSRKLHLEQVTEFLRAQAAAHSPPSRPAGETREAGASERLRTTGSGSG